MDTEMPASVRQAFVKLGEQIRIIEANRSLLSEEEQFVMLTRINVGTGTLTVNLVSPDESVRIEKVLDRVEDFSGWWIETMTAKPWIVRH